MKDFFPVLLLGFVLGAACVVLWFRVRPRASTIPTNFNGANIPPSVFAVLLLGQRVAEITTNKHRACALVREYTAKGRHSALVEYKAHDFVDVGGSEK